MRERFWVGERLIYLHKDEIQGNIWDDHWPEERVKTALELDRMLAIAEYEEVFSRYIDKNLLVVEAGCGPCRILHALTLRNYDCFGIDNSLKLLRTVRKYRKDLRLGLMNIDSMAICDSACGSYISLGVMEHFPEGIERPLVEARRVLRHGGIVFIQVPHFNRLRRYKTQKGKIKRLSFNSVPWARFYQYAFTPQEVKKIIVENGFEYVDERYFRVMKGLKDELPFISWVYNFYFKLLARSFIFSILAKIVSLFLKLVERTAEFPFIRKHCSHMVMIIARKSFTG